MFRRRKINLKPFIVAVVVAILVHLQLILTDVLPNMYEFWTGLFPKLKLEEPTEVTLVALSERDWEENRQVLQKARVKEEQQQEEAVREEEEEEDELKGQVVDVAPTPDDSRPKNAKFLSENNTNVEKESVSRYRKKDYGVAQPRPTVAQFSRKKPEKPIPEESEDRVAVLTKKQGSRDAAQTREKRALAMEIPDMEKRESLRLKLDMDLGQLPTYEASDKVMGNSDRLRLQMGRQEVEGEVAGDEGEDKQTVAMFKRPSLENFDMVTGAPANDHIRDVPKGEETLLNSREFRFATFFNRVKRGVSNHWNPGEVYLRHDPYGNIYGVKDRYTVLNVELDGEGMLKDVNVAQSSGVGFLDDEAISAFHGASPFPNPPEGLVESDGNIRFQFGFYFEIGERPKFRAFRYRRF
jgi:TonB family protein